MQKPGCKEAWSKLGDAQVGRDDLPAKEKEAVEKACYDSKAPAAPPGPLRYGRRGGQGTWFHQRPRPNRYGPRRTSPW